MRQFLEVFIYIVSGIILFWFGYTLFIDIGIPALGLRPRKRRNIKPKAEGLPGDPQICPVCSAKLDRGELVSSVAFPSLNGGKDRFMHIKGCLYCIGGDRDRVCPVCGIMLKGTDLLISRFFERQGRRAHVHVLGCTQCRKSR